MKKAIAFAILIFVTGCARTPVTRVFSSAPDPATPKSIASKDAQDEFDRGVKAYRGEQYTIAQQHFQNVTKIDPNMPEAHLDLALALYHQGKIDEAKKEFERASNLYEKQFGGMGAGGKTPSGSR